MDAKCQLLAYAGVKLPGNSARLREQLWTDEKPDYADMWTPIKQYYRIGA